MSVEGVFAKICNHNKDIHGCILAAGDRIYHNLSEPYDLIDREELSEQISNILLLTEGLEEAASDFDAAFLEFEGHSVFGKRIDDATLTLICTPISRTGFKKVQVGLNLFIKPLRKALSEAQAGPAAGPAPAEQGFPAQTPAAAPTAVPTPRLGIARAPAVAQQTPARPAPVVNTPPASLLPRKSFGAAPPPAGLKAPPLRATDPDDGAPLPKLGAASAPPPPGAASLGGVTAGLDDTPPPRPMGAVTDAPQDPVAKTPRTGPPDNTPPPRYRPGDPPPDLSAFDDDETQPAGSLDAKPDPEPDPAPTKRKRIYRGVEY